MHPGCHVVCINDKFSRVSEHYRVRYGYRFPVKGTVYTIRAVHEGISIPGPACLLEEIVNPEVPVKLRGRMARMEKRFKADRFRPLKKLRVEDFTGTNVPIRETA